MSVPSYKFKDGAHVYGCTQCSWTVTYPKERVHHARQAEAALRLHVLGCHRTKRSLPSSMSSDRERELMDGVTSTIKKAADYGVHPGDILAVMAGGFCGLAQGAGLTLDNALEVIRAWWAEGEESPS